MTKLLLIGLGALAIFLALQMKDGCGMCHASTDPSRPLDDGLVLLSVSKCGFCKQMREYLGDKSYSKIQVFKLDEMEQGAAVALLDQLLIMHNTPVPAAVVRVSGGNEKTVIGFTDEMRKLIDAHRS